jgi:hypothetical protein
VTMTIPSERHMAGNYVAHGFPPNNRRDVRTFGFPGSLSRIPRGSHTIRALFGDTSLRKLSKYPSMGSLLLLISVMMFMDGSNRSQERSPMR